MSAWRAPGLVVAVGLALALGVLLGPRACRQSALPLVQAGDMVYDSSAFVPSEFPEHGAKDLSYGGQGLSFAPDRASILFGCHSPLAYARITTPPSTFAAPCLWPGGEPGSGSHIGGTLVFQGRTVVSKYVFYDGDGSAWVGHQFSDDDGATWSPLMRVGALDVNGNHLNVGYVAGYMGHVPPEWREALGAPAFTGQGVLSIISRTSSGPAAFGFDPTQLDEGLASGMTEATPWLYYTLEHPLSDPEVANPLFTRSDLLGGAFFIPGTRSFLVVGTHGAGPICYGSGTSVKEEHGTPGPDGMTRCYDPSTGSQGEHAYPYHLQVWAYDVEDFVKVRQGALQPWEVRPYAVWRPPSSEPPPFDPENYKVRRGGVSYDPLSGRLAVAGEFHTSPRLDLWRVTVPGGPPPAVTYRCAMEVTGDSAALLTGPAKCEPME